MSQCGNCELLGLAADKLVVSDGVLVFFMGSLKFIRTVTRKGRRGYLAECIVMLRLRMHQHGFMNYIALGTRVIGVGNCLAGAEIRMDRGQSPSPVLECSLTPSVSCVWLEHSLHRGREKITGAGIGAAAGRPRARSRRFLVCLAPPSLLADCGS